ncbi:LytR/AlgR family response regulator transcription factor [Bacillus xiapuensis]|uniref:LytR/AlgR family response regulator transcription factor n=1 Tax=Bacillus xiapuensis TaxID=2014075 RepID=UPI000C236A7B|nr:LytTR family DNA-binding domain-containing protein [Bacillus xiapuensis]
MKVIICEDDATQLEYIYSKLQKYALIQYPSIEFTLATSSPEDILTYIEHDREDCYFLDIELGSSLTGLELAGKIKDRDPQASIIFVTTHAEMLQLTFTYKLAALDFIVKREQTQLTHQLITALEVAYQKYKQLGHVDEGHYFQLKIGELIKNIPYEEIYFFATSSQVHKIELHTKNGRYEFYGKLKALESLDSRFYRCHKSYIINLQHIREINKKDRTLTMTNTETCYISFRALRGLQIKMTEWTSSNRV